MLPGLGNGGNKNTFNIDDVGYANASDVNMNVGSLNSSAYDQSQRWRDKSHRLMDGISTIQLPNL